MISGVPVTVDRGWGSVEVKVRNSPWFKFVNTHFEAFGDDKNKVVDCMTTPAPEFASNPVSIRCCPGQGALRDRDRARQPAGRTDR